MIRKIGNIKKVNNYNFFKFSIFAKCLLVLLCIFYISNANADIGDITTSNPKGQLYFGAIFKSDFNVDVGDNSLGSFHFKIVYDKNVFKIIKVENGDSDELPGEWLFYSDKGGELIINNVSLPVKRADGIINLFKITFQVINNIDILTSIDINVISLLDPDADDIHYNVVDSIIQINKLEISEIIQCLKTLNGLSFFSSGMDINNDLRFGLAEVIFMMKYISKLNL